MQDLKRENLRLREVQGKDYWSFKGQDNKDSSTKIGVSGKNGTPYCIPSRDSSHNGNGISFEDLYMNTTTWGDKSKTKTEVWNLLKFGSEAIAPIHPITAGIASRSSDMIEALVKRREVAMSQYFQCIFVTFGGNDYLESRRPLHASYCGFVHCCWHVTKECGSVLLYNKEQACFRCRCSHKLQLVPTWHTYIPNIASDCSYIVSIRIKVLGSTDQVTDFLGLTSFFLS